MIIQLLRSLFNQLCNFFLSISGSVGRILSDYAGREQQLLAQLKADYNLPVDQQYSGVMVDYNQQQHSRGGVRCVMCDVCCSVFDLLFLTVCVLVCY